MAPQCPRLKMSAVDQRRRVGAQRAPERCELGVSSDGLTQLRFKPAYLDVGMAALGGAGRYGAVRFLNLGWTNSLGSLEAHAAKLTEVVEAAKLFSQIERFSMICHFCS